MAIATSNSVSLPQISSTNGQLTDEFINALVQGGSWQFGAAPRVLTYSFNINYEIDTAGNVIPGVGGAWTASLRDAVTRSLMEWSNVANINFQNITSGSYFYQSAADIAFTLTGDELKQDGAIGMGVFPDPVMASIFRDTAALDGVTYLSAAGDVFFDNYASELFNLLPGGFGMEVLLHEIGHSLGLKHPDDDGGNNRPSFASLGISDRDSARWTLMSNNEIVGSTWQLGNASTPMPLDILAIQQIYGANTSYHSGSDIYALTPNTSHPYHTIWDAGGLDTIDVSGFSASFPAATAQLPFAQGLTIDLRPGFGFVEYSLAKWGYTAIAFGTVIENVIGSAARDTITGNDADNRIDGGSGLDTMAGGLGNDTYIVRDLNDVIVENMGDGEDTVISVAAQYTLGANLERLILDAGAGGVGGTGNELNNLITGNSSGNRLDGAGGTDTIAGGAGDDAYIFDGTADVFVEQTNEGSDTVEASSSFTLPANIENLLLLGSSNTGSDSNGARFSMQATSGVERFPKDLVIYDSVQTQGGQVIVEALDGSDADLLVDRFSIQFFIPGQPGPRVAGVAFQGGLFGEQFGNQVSLSPGRFDARSFASLGVMYQGQGPLGRLDNGSYFEISVAKYGIGVPINLAETLIPVVEFHATYDLVLMMTTGPEHIRGEININNQTASSPGNAAIIGIGNDLSNALSGNEADNLLMGGLSDDTLFGASGNDTLDGGSEADRLIGGTGNDTYAVDTQSDLVFENPNEGTDSVLSSVSFYLYDNIENITLTTGSGNNYVSANGLANQITGNEGGNLLIGWDGNDTINGGAGNDIIYGVNDNDQLNGEAGIDVLIAGQGNDTLDGGDNPDEMYGEDGNDILYGGTGLFTDILVGGTGNDTLDGSANPGGGQPRNQGDFDYLYGGTGDDTFYVDTPADLVFEFNGLTEGNDTVIADINGAGFYLYDGIENLTLINNTVFGVGNTLNNTITGNTQGTFLLGGAGNDTLNGKGGNDVLFGEAGADTFVFERGTGGDVIGDFQQGQDKIKLVGIGYSGITEILARTIEVAGTSAIDLGAGDFVVINGIAKANLNSLDFLLA